MPQKTTVHGFNVIYDESVSHGIYYLRDDLDYSEAKVFFDQARSHGLAPFEDKMDRQYTLLYKDGVFTLVSR